MVELTERQKEVFEFIVTYIYEKGYSPSFGEIGKGVYMSKSSVARHISILIQKGYIEFTPHVSRSIIMK